MLGELFLIVRYASFESGPKSLWKNKDYSLVPVSTDYEKDVESREPDQAN